MLVFPLFGRLVRHERRRRLHESRILAWVQRRLRPLLIHLVVVSRRFLLPRAARERRVSNFEFKLLSLRNVLGVVAEAVQELALDHGLAPVLLSRLLPQLLELQSLQVDLLEPLHSRIVLHRTLESALRNLGEARQGLHLEVTPINKLVDVFLVHLLKFVLEASVVLGHLKGVRGRSRAVNFLLWRLLLPLGHGGRALVS